MRRGRHPAHLRGGRAEFTPRPARLARWTGRHISSPFACDQRFAMENATIDATPIIELDATDVRRVKKTPRKLYAFYLLPLSLAGLGFTLYAYGWPLPVAGCAVLVGFAAGVLARDGRH